MRKGFDILTYPRSRRIVQVQLCEHAAPRTILCYCRRHRRDYGGATEATLLLVSFGTNSKSEAKAPTDGCIDLARQSLESDDGRGKDRHQ